MENLLEITKYDIVSKWKNIMKFRWIDKTYNVKPQFNPDFDLEPSVKQIKSMNCHRIDES